MDIHGITLKGAECLLVRPNTVALYEDGRVAREMMQVYSCNSAMEKCRMIEQVGVIDGWRCPMPLEHKFVVICMGGGAQVSTRGSVTVGGGSSSHHPHQKKTFAVAGSSSSSSSSSHAKPTEYLVPLEDVVAKAREYVPPQWELTAHNRLGKGLAASKQSIQLLCTLENTIVVDPNLEYSHYEIIEAPIDHIGEAPASANAEEKKPVIRAVGSAPIGDDDDDDDDAGKNERSEDVTFVDELAMAALGGAAGSDVAGYKLMSQMSSPYSNDKMAATSPYDNNQHHHHHVDKKSFDGEGRTSSGSNVSAVDSYESSDASSSVSLSPDPSEEDTTTTSALHLNDAFDLRVGLLQEGGFKRNVDVYLLIRSFLNSASSLGRVIVEEAFTKEKTIKPIKDSGTLGGRKYLARNILFKFATDEANLFDSSLAAHKVAGHELKGLMTYQSLGIADLKFPLMTLVDYLGFRLIAMTMLPISSDSIVYGSDDAGKTVHKNADVDSIMEKAAGMLNLAKHRAGADGSTRKELWSAVDMEVHLGSDNQFYAIDFSRAMPSNIELDSGFPRNSHLYMMFRSEFVARWRVPLSPDAYSAFQDPKEALFHNNNVSEAVHGLYASFPAVAESLQSIWLTRLQRYDSVSVAEELHRFGVNIRFLGRIWEHVSSPSLRKLIHLEMTARCFKHHFRARLRQAAEKEHLNIGQTRLELIRLLNDSFGASKECDDMLRIIQLSARVYFGLEQLEIWTREKFMKCEFNHVPGLVLVLRKTCTSLGISVPVDIEKNMTLEAPFSVTSGVTTAPVMRGSTTLSAAAAKAAMLESSLSSSNSQAIFLLKEALRLLRPALESRPTDTVLLGTFAQTNSRLGSLIQYAHPHEYRFHLAMAAEYFSRAVELDEDDSEMHLNCARQYAALGLNPKAQHHFLRCLQLDPNNIAALEAYGGLLVKQGHPDANSFFLRARKVAGDSTGAYGLLGLIPDEYVDIVFDEAEKTLFESRLPSHARSQAEKKQKKPEGKKHKRFSIARRKPKQGRQTISKRSSSFFRKPDSSDSSSSSSRSVFNRRSPVLSVSRSTETNLTLDRIDRGGISTSLSSPHLSLNDPLYRSTPSLPLYEQLDAGPPLKQSFEL